MTTAGAQRCDVLIVGGGIVGLATARRFQTAAPSRSVLVLEKENAVAGTRPAATAASFTPGSTNAPGSLRARNCRRGVELLLRFCREHDIPYRLSGKVIVAADETECDRLHGLLQRGNANGVPGLRLLDRSELREIEPHTEGVAALHSPTSGVVRFGEVAATLRRLVEEDGGRVEIGARVVGVTARSERTRVVTAKAEYDCRLLITCAGLHADRWPGWRVTNPASGSSRFAASTTGSVPSAPRSCSALSIPCRIPGFPFLACTSTETSTVRWKPAPNAVLALAREGYRRRDLNLRDLGEIASYSGFWRLALREWRAGADEIHRSLSKRAFTRRLRRLVPELEASDLTPSPSGVRAIAVLPDGRIADDFRILRCENRIHVLNAPSPAATASLAIAEQVAVLAADS